MIRHYGPEFLDDPRLNPFHRAYIRVFGIPISGLRIRLRRILPEILAVVRARKARVIADLGCGKGIFAFELARAFPEANVVGIDIDEEQVRVNREVAERHAHRNVRFEAGDILKLGRRDEFDVVVSVDNLEHIADDVAALREIYAALKPGGVLVCHVPAHERVWIFRGRSANFDVPGHMRPGYRETELRDRLAAAGFSIQSLKATYGYLETISNNVSYLITGAAQKNAPAYALAFPILNAVAWLGRRQDPGGRGAGWLAIAVKAGASSHD